MGVVTNTTSTPAAALVLTAAVNVNVVPFAETDMLLTVMCVSRLPVVVNDTAVAPVRFCPVMVTVGLVFRVSVAGEMALITGPVVAETARLAIARGSPTATATGLASTPKILPFNTERIGLPATNADDGPREIVKLGARISDVVLGLRILTSAWELTAVSTWLVALMVTSKALLMAGD